MAWLHRPGRTPKPRWLLEVNLVLLLYSYYYRYDIAVCRRYDRPRVTKPPLGPLGLLGCIELELPPACSGKTHAASAASSVQQYFLCQCSLERDTNAQPAELLTLIPPLISTTTSTSVPPGPSWYGSAAAPSLLDLDLRLALLLLVLYSKVS